MTVEDKVTSESEISFAPLPIFIEAVKVSLKLFVLASIALSSIRAVK